MKLRTSHKGLILVTVPLVFELILCTGLFYLVKESEKTAQAASRARQIYSLINATLSDSLQFVRTLEKIDVFAEEDLEGKMNGEIQKISDAQQKIIELTNNEPQYQEMLTEFANRTNEMKRAYTVMMPLYRDKEWGKLAKQGLKLKNYYKRVLTSSNSVDRWKTMAHADFAMGDAEPKKQAELRTQIMTLLAAGVIVSIISALWLALFFSKQISNRLEIMSTNNKRFKEHQPLLPKVTGSDEISDLDSGFHDMAIEMEAARQRDIAAQRLRNQVVAMVTHDLRTPLNTISAFVDFVDTEHLNEQESRLKTIAERNVLRMSDLIDDLLELEKLQSGTLHLDKSEFVLAQAANEATEMVLGLLEKKALSLDVQGNLDLLVSADKRRIVQVFANLIGNAAKFSRNSTAITVNIAKEGNLAVASVSDTGPGIAEEKLKLIFEPFEQAGSEAGGAGLGLAICKELLKAHKGEIAATSQLGTGSTFTFKFPAES